MRSLRVRTNRGQVVVTGGGVPIAMTADEARAFARALIAEADEADPIQRDRAFGEDLVEDVPARTTEPNRLDAAAMRYLADLNRRLARARVNDDRVDELVIRTEAKAHGYDVRIGGVFEPIGKAPANAWRPVGAGRALNLVEVDR